MRIISQNGCYNMNYSRVHIIKFSTNIKFGITTVDASSEKIPSNEMDIGLYSTKEQRDAVFEDIIASGASDVKVFRMPEDNTYDSV